MLKVKNIVVGLCREQLSPQGNYRALLHPDLLQVSMGPKEEEPMRQRLLLLIGNCKLKLNRFYNRLLNWLKIRERVFMSAVVKLRYRPFPVTKNQNLLLRLEDGEAAVKTLADRAQLAPGSIYCPQI